MDPQDAWLTAHKRLEQQFSRSTFRVYLRGVDYLSCEDGHFRLGARGSHKLAMLNKQLHSFIQSVLSDVMGTPCQVTYEALPPLPEPEPVEDDTPLFALADAMSSSGSTSPWGASLTTRPSLPPLPDSTLNGLYTLERFVADPANAMLMEAVRATMVPPAHYNPLYIYGAVGLGKTHLLHAIAHACLTEGRRALYITSEAFTNDLVVAINKKQQAMFRERYRTVDVLLVDDVQFLVGKNLTQEEFFNTFNTLITHHRQIVLVGDRPPGMLPVLEDRMTSRFGGGLAVDVQPPSLETRMAILQMWAREKQFEMPTHTVEPLAARARNVRELEGLFNYALASARAQRSTTITALATSTALDKLTRPRHYGRMTTLQAVMEQTAAAFQLSPDDLVGPGRSRPVAEARHVAMYLARELTDASLVMIGAQFGGRKHSSVLHAVDRIKQDIEANPHLRARVEKLRAQLSDGR